MTQTAKLFMTGRSQAVRLPLEFRFTGEKEVFIQKDPQTGNVILSKKPEVWGDIFKLLDGVKLPDNFLDEDERNQGVHTRDPFAWLNQSVSSK